MIEIIAGLFAVIVALLGAICLQSSSHKKTKKKLSDSQRKEAAANAKAKMVKKRIEIDEEVAGLSRDELIDRMRDDFRD